jgi:hypothetical protein
MPFDAKLAGRVRRLLAGQSRLTEREQFGGVGFMIRGNMAVGVLGEDLLVRVGPDQHEAASKDPHARPFALTGRPSNGWVLVGPGGTRSPASLKKWVDLGVTFARTLPPK